MTLATLFALAAAAAEVPPVPELPADLPAARVPVFDGSLAHQPGWAGAALGSGRLAPAAPEPFDIADWLSGVVLPLYDLPDGEPSGWLARGWHVRGDERRPLITPVLVETDYEFLSLIVLELRCDGWFRLRHGDGDGGISWSHLAFLELGSVPLRYEPWPEVFENPERQPLHFRDRSSRHVLRSEASAESDAAAQIGDDHAIVPLEVDGDWMRVQVRQPTDECLEPGDWQGSETEGWIRWWADDRGSLLWFHPRGC